MRQYPAVTAALAALLLSPLAPGQGLLLPAAELSRAPLLPSLPLPAASDATHSSQPERASALVLALRGVEPYAEFYAAGMPLPPSPAELAELGLLRRLQEQAALKQVWMERLIRAQEERSRITRENLSRSAAMARKLGAPSAFADSLGRMAAGNLSPRERHLHERYQQAVLDAYGVDARELRFFVEASGLSPEALRDVAAWLPLPALFTLPLVEDGEAVSAARLGAEYVAFLAARRDAVSILSSVHDAASAEAAADALLPVLLRQLTTRDALFATTEDFRAAVLAPYARFAAPVSEAFTRERTRLMQQRWYGSYRLLTLDYLLQ